MDGKFLVMSMASFSTVDEYLAAIPSDIARETLVKLRAIIRDEIPDAEEVISYGMPMFKHRGMVIGYAFFKKHSSLFPGGTVERFADKLDGYKTSKGTIQFPHDHLMPEALIREIARNRYDENERLFQEKKKK